MISLIAAIPLLFGAVPPAVQATMDYEFTVCGVKHRFADGKIDWSHNPTYNGYREWPWQFARMGFLYRLAKYYRASGDEKAARTYVNILTSFIDGVPPPSDKVGPGGTKSWRTLDSGIRATVWAHTFSDFTNSPSFTPEFFAKLKRSVRDHILRLDRPRKTNNWRFTELRGYVSLLLAFPDTEEAAERLAAAERELAEILGDQLYPDGFQFELAPGYHSVMDGDYSGLAASYRRFGRTPPPFLEAGIELAYELYPHLTAPDRRLPDVNDSPRVGITGPMRKASALFPGRADFRWFATGGKEGAPPPYLSYAFPYSGAVVFRDSWKRDAVWGYVDMSPFGYSHQHEDSLNFLLFAYGREMLCEGGKYAYDTSETRRYVLSTRSHNTIRIDGKDQNARRSWKWKPEMLHKKADLVFETTPARDTAVSTYVYGYGRGKAWDGSVKHTRKVEFIKEGEDAPLFRITDGLVSSDDREHSYEQIWHLEKCVFDLGPDRFRADFGKGVTLDASFRSENGKLVDMIGTKEPEYQGWKPIMPMGPHEHRPIHTPVLKGTFKGAAEITVEFRPRRAR